MFSGKELLIDGPAYSMFGKSGKVLYLGKLENRDKHTKGYALRFENFFDRLYLKSLEDKLFFIDPPDWCDECYEDMVDDCCCCCSPFPTEKSESVLESMNNNHMWGIVYSEK